MTNESSSAFGTNRFNFDHTFDMKSTQKDVYDTAARPIIDSVLDGFNGTIFAYGQTGSGKTWTMWGSEERESMYGVTLRAIHELFKLVEEEEKRGSRFEVRLSMMQLYLDKLQVRTRKSAGVSAVCL